MPRLVQREKGDWWLTLHLGRANDRSAMVVHNGETLNLTDEEFEYRVEIIPKSGKKITSETGRFRARLKELESGK